MKKKLSLLLIASCIPSIVHAENQENEGYSYFSLGMENTSYKEFYSKSNSSVSVTSPTINTGGLYSINNKWDFSIDALGTFSQNHSNEHWNNGQKNQFEYIKAMTDVLLQYKLTPQWRIVAGPTLSYQTYKRYGRDSSTESIFTGVWEEKTTDIYANVGIAYDSGNLYNNWHYYVQAKAGIPLYSQTENTATELNGVTFNTFGYRSSLSGGISYRLMKGIHLGLFTALSYEYRQEDGPKFTGVIIESNGKKQAMDATLPEAQIINFSAGIQVLWKL
ncbi:hypothetical protein [Photobacterium damselae]|uniref:hypothetical protein n=1 Tax=Photobacterium damselae TaxID=38293 RepID=UPI000D051DC4|nr:hypothetical protein [Photobacterium damselae]PSB78407.1 hypothetical protein C5F62_17055 [Photobacterium damselae subsp. damselae]